MPYRDAPELPCPRCTKPMPGLDVLRCDCGVWISALVAPILLAEAELRPNPVTRWWRKREPCPLCDEQMTLRNNEPGLFQGCDLHGFWIDADTIEHTGLARGIDEDAVRRRREDPAAIAELAAIAQDREAGVRARRESKLREQREADAAAKRVAEDRARAFVASLETALGAEHARELLHRIAVLEDTIAALERRLARVEAGPTLY